jgi:alpha-glucosidase
VRVLANLGEGALPLPQGDEVLVSSLPDDAELSGGLPTDATVWLRSSP